jgi:hypothetical protein
MQARFAVGARAGLAGIAILAVLGGALTTTSLQQDFAAYYTAGAATRLGLDPYLNQLPTAAGPWDGIAIYRHSRFLYPPLLARAFEPLGTLPYAWAKAIFTAASVVALVLAMNLVARDAPSSRGRPLDLAARVLPLSFAAWVPVFLCLERGQIDLLLLLPLAAAWHWRRRPLAAGALLALAMMAKPIVMGVLPLLPCGRQFRWAASTVAALVLLAAATLAICGSTQSLQYAGEVLPRVARYGEGGPETLLLDDAHIAPVAEDLSQGVARIDGRGRAYAQEIGTFRRNASLPRLLAGIDAPSIRVSLLATVVLGTALAFAARRSSESSSWYWGGLVAAVIASPVSWAMDLVWALPLFFLRPTGAGTWDRSTRALLAMAFVAGTMGPLFPGGWVLAGLAAVAAAVTIAIPWRSSHE